MMDKILKDALAKEKRRQNNNIELIASENFVSKDILKLQGSILTNKYAEGYPGKRYYGGCENVDVFESVAIEYAKKLFNSKYANVQPHSGSSANMAVYRALLDKGDTVLGMNLSHGGHLTHGSSLSFSGQDYNIVEYSLSKETEMIDYNDVLDKALKYKPKMIIAGASAYPRKIDFARFREIADKVGAYLMVDMAHIAGLVAAGFHENPLKHADVVTTTTHKTLRGPRGGMILTNDEEISKKINKAVFPGIQGGPLMHVIAAKAQCLSEALTSEFKDYQRDVIKNSKALAETLISEGFKLSSGGTDNHLILVDTLSSRGLNGKECEEILDKINITVNKNMIPFDELTPAKTSGIRLGSAAMTTRGLKESDFKEIGKIISLALKQNVNKNTLRDLKKRVHDITKKYPLNY